MKKKKAKKCDINKIKYYDEDKRYILSLYEEFKTNATVSKTKGITRKNWSTVVKGIGHRIAEIESLVSTPFSLSIPAQINHIFFKYWNNKKRFVITDNCNKDIEKSLDKLTELVAIVSAGNVYKMRQNLLNPLCVDLKYFIDKDTKWENIFFNSGIKGLFNIEKVVYPLNLIEENVNKRIIQDSKRIKTKRMFYIHVGKTNSGKTYQSIQMLKKAEKGAYLSPLRLLALEISENLNRDGIPCSFVTGEDEKRIEGAKHIASTVELADFSREYDVAVIDECQMISDHSRGYAWTKAIMNIRAREICLCTAPEALEVLIKIIDSCGDFYKVINHRRKTPLIVEDKPFNINDIQRGDALVAFSRQKVNAIGAQLIKMGIDVSVLYGALPYSARIKQFDNFIQGKSKVLVTTDAIGMGVNLPVRRIVFMETYKFDGRISRPLTSGEVKQIAGRAGRRGIFDEGFVNANGERELEYITKKLKKKTEKVNGICISFPKKILEDSFVNLRDTLEAWECYKVSSPYIKENLRETIDNLGLVLNVYNRLNKKINKADIYELASMPVDSRNIAVKKLWLKYINSMLMGYRYLKKPHLMGRSIEDYLNYSKMLDTYFLCSKSWGLDIDFGWLEFERKRCNEALIEGLIDDVEEHSRYCEKCGNILEWNIKGCLCERCRDER